MTVKVYKKRTRWYFKLLGKEILVYEASFLLALEKTLDRSSFYFKLSFDPCCSSKRFRFFLFDDFYVGDDWVKLFSRLVLHNPSCNTVIKLPRCIDRDEYCFWIDDIK